MDCYNKNISLVTSTVTLEEYSVYPFSHNDERTVKIFKTFLDGMKIKVVDVNKEIAFEAARIRAKYEAFKALDSIHLATAKLTECKIFLTNDNQLRQMTELNVVTMEDL